MGEINLYDKIVIKNKKKRTWGNQRNCLHKSPSIRWFGNGIHSC